MKQRHITQRSILSLLPRRLLVPVLAGASALSLAACQGADTHELGYTSVPRDLNGEEPSQPSEPFYTSQSDFVGTWVGEALDPLAFGADPDAPRVYRFPSGSTQFLLQLEQLDNSSGGSGLGGTLTFGEGEPPAPATDPDKGYPVGFNYDAFGTYDPAQAFPGLSINYDFGLQPFEGFAYPVTSAEISGSDVPDGVLRLGYTTSAYIGSWCELQAPIAWPDGSYHIVPFAEGGIETLADGTDSTCQLFGPPDLSACPENYDELPPDEQFEVFLQCMQQAPIAELSCDKVYLSSFCECYETGCFAGYGQNSKNLMLRASGDELVAVFENALFSNPRGLSTALGEVRFRRASESNTVGE